MSICAALVYIQKDGLCFVLGFFLLVFFVSSFKFGLSSEVRARTLERKPLILLLV